MGQNLLRYFHFILYPLWKSPAISSLMQNPLCNLKLIPWKITCTIIQFVYSSSYHHLSIHVFLFSSPLTCILRILPPPKRRQKNIAPVIRIFDPAAPNRYPSNCALLQRIPHRRIGGWGTSRGTYRWTGCHAVDHCASNC